MSTIRATRFRTRAGTLTPEDEPSSYLMVCEVCDEESAPPPGGLDEEPEPGRRWALDHAVATGHDEFRELIILYWTPEPANPNTLSDLTAPGTSAGPSPLSRATRVNLSRPLGR